MVKLGGLLQKSHLQFQKAHQLLSSKWWPPWFPIDSTCWKKCPKWCVSGWNVMTFPDFVGKIWPMPWIPIYMAQFLAKIPVTACELLTLALTATAAGGSWWCLPGCHMFQDRLNMTELCCNSKSYSAALWIPKELRTTGQCCSQHLNAIMPQSRTTPKLRTSAKLVRTDVFWENPKMRFLFNIIAWPIYWPMMTNVYTVHVEVCCNSTSCAMWVHLVWSSHRSPSSGAACPPRTWRWRPKHIKTILRLKLEHKTSKKGWEHPIFNTFIHPIRIPTYDWNILPVPAPHPVKLVIFQPFSHLRDGVFHWECAPAPWAKKTAGTRSWQLKKNLKNKNQVPSVPSLCKFVKIKNSMIFLFLLMFSAAFIWLLVRRCISWALSR